MAKVIRLFGKADNFNIEFSRKGRVWKTDIPPDMTDGVYAVQLTAIDELGESAYWVGELFMCRGVCCLKIERRQTGCFFSAKRYRTDFLPVSRTEFSAKEYGCTFSENLRMHFEIEESKRYTMQFSVSDRIGFSKGTDMDFTAKKLLINSGEKRMLMQCATVLNIGKECSHV